MIRFPNGERRQQSFRHTDTIRDVYRYVDSLGIPGIGSYQLPEEDVRSAAAGDDSRRRRFLSERDVVH